jgi:hypothetical protein
LVVGQIGEIKMSDRKIYLDDAIDAVAEGLKHTFVEYRDIAEKMLNNVPSAQPMQTDKDFEKQIHAMFDHIWDCEIEHPIFQDTVGDLMKAVIQAHNNSAQPEIIRCGQCKYAEVADKEDAQDGYTCQFHRGSIWFSGSYCSWAERRQE